MSNDTPTPPPPRHEHFKEREERRSCDFWHHSRKKQLSPGILVQVHQPVTPQCKSSREESELHPGIGALEHRALLATCLSNSEGSSSPTLQPLKFSCCPTASEWFHTRVSTGKAVKKIWGGFLLIRQASHLLLFVTRGHWLSAALANAALPSSKGW